jgi:vacuolar-type H+-ATPase subunit D/Vma8
MPNRSRLTNDSEAVEPTQIELTERKRLIRDEGTRAKLMDRKRQQLLDEMAAREAKDSG